MIVPKRFLEIGPTPKKALGTDWDTLDVHPYPGTTFVADVNKPLTFIKNETYEIVYASHIIEHIPWFNTIVVLKEFWRILKSGGVLEIWCPDFEKLVKAYLEQKVLDKWFLYNPKRDPTLWVSGRIFAYDREGTDSNNWHRAVFDEKHLKSCLSEAGFVELENLVKPRGYDHGAINLGVSGKK